MSRTGYTGLMGDPGWRTRLSAFCCGATMWLMASAFPAAGQEEQLVTLKYKESTSPVAYWSLNIEPRGAFAHEPPGLNSRALRGFFRLTPTDQHGFPFVWDTARGKLFIDLNRNNDLTDDSPAVSVFGSGLAGLSTAQFTNVHFTVNTGEGETPVMADISMYNYGQLRGTIMYRCYWEGEVRLGGRDWQVGLVQDLANPSGNPQLLLRPWRLRDAVFSTGDGSLSTIAKPNHLFVGDQGYLVNAHSVSKDGKAVFQIGFKPVQLETGELDLRGSYLERVVLTGSKCTVLLDNPSGKVRIPAGEYGAVAAAVSAGAVRAESENVLATSGLLVVRPGGSAALMLGGPLTNKVTVTRESRTITLNYSLVGAGGGTYRLLSQRTNPNFKIMQGSTLVHSGQFEFG